MCCKRAIITCLGHIFVWSDLKNTLQQVRKDCQIDHNYLKQNDQPEQHLKTAFCRLMPKKLLCGNSRWCRTQERQKVQQTFGYPQPCPLCRQLVQGIHTEPNDVDTEKIRPEYDKVQTVPKEEEKKTERDYADQGISDKSSVYDARSILKRHSPTVMTLPFFPASLI